MLSSVARVASTQARLWTAPQTVLLFALTHPVSVCNLVSVSVKARLTVRKFDKVSIILLCGYSINSKKIFFKNNFSNLLNLLKNIECQRLGGKIEKIQFRKCQV